MTVRHPLVVVGAGPAGIAAALTAAAQGMRPVLLDRQSAPGGQIYRDIERTPLAERRILGSDYWRGKELVDRLRASEVDYRPGTTVWQVTPDRELGIRSEDGAAVLRADRLILAAGAQERPFPIPGWTLPGVLGAGAAQVLLKTSAVVPKGPLVLAGTGPLLFLLAAQYERAGVHVSLILETTPSANRRMALRHMPGALIAPRYLAKGLALLHELKRHSVRRIRGVEALRAEGDGVLEAVSWRRRGRRQRLATDTLLLHSGVVPELQATFGLGCAHFWDDTQLSWRPRLSPWFETDIPGISVAGDGGGIVGACASQLQGGLAALQAAAATGHLSSAERDRLARPLRRRLAREHAARAFVDTLYRPAPAWHGLDDDALVCRCEEVTAGELRRLVRDGCTGPSQMKSFTRCGMGPCQGRLCGLTVSGLLAAESGRTVAETGHYRVRPPLIPIALGDLAGLADRERTEQWPSNGERQ